MADAEATGLIKVKADASQAVREVGLLKGSFAALGKEVKESFGGNFSKAIDNAAVGLAKFNLAVGGISTAIGLVSKGLDAMRDVSAFHKLERAVPIETFRRLDEATNGLFKKQELLRFSAQALSADFSFTETQMADVLKASVALSDKGFGETAQISEKLTKAIVKGGEGLDDFNIILDKSQDKAHVLSEALSKIHNIASDGAISEETKSIAEMDRGMEDLALTLKETLVPVIKVMVDLLSETIRGWDDMLGGIERRQAVLAQRQAEFARDQVRAGISFRADVDAARERDTRGRYAGLAPDTFTGDASYYSALTAPLGDVSTKALPWVHRDKIEVVEPYNTNARDVGEHEVDAWYQTGQGDFGGSAWDSGALGALENRQDSESWWNRGGRGGGLGRDRNADNRMANFEKNLNDTSSITGAAFATISGGITAAVDAAITGSDSIGKAAAKASSQVLKSLSVEATGRAVYEGALALGSLAIGDFKGAGAHGLAAAKYAAAAAVTGTLAAGLGALASGGGAGAGSGASAGAPGGGFGSATGGSRGDGPLNITVNVGYGFDGDAKKLGRVIAQEVRNAERSGTGRGGRVATQFNG